MGRIKKVLGILGNGINAMIHGELLLRLHVDRYFMHILYTFVVLWLSIIAQMKVERTMAAVEKNKATLSDMKIYHAQKTVQMVSLNRISTVQAMLEEKGSDVTIPEKPAIKIRKVHGK